MPLSKPRRPRWLPSPSTCNLPTAAQTYFAVKARFAAADAAGDYEHLWLYDITPTPAGFIGRIGNEPLYATHLRLDEQVTVSTADISDWMIIENGVLKGGYTMRVLRDRLSPHEREQFDASIDFKILEE